MSVQKQSHSHDQGWLSRDTLNRPDITEMSFDLVQNLYREPAVWQMRRSAAWERFASLPKPTTRTPGWKYCDLSNLKIEDLNLIPVRSGEYAGWEGQLGYLLSRATEVAGEQATVNDVPVFRHIDPNLTEKGVIYDDIRSVMSYNPQLVERILGLEPDANEIDRFEALGRAFFNGGHLLYVPKGVVIEKPFEIVRWGHNVGVSYFPYTVIWLEEGARASILENTRSAQQAAQTMSIGNTLAYVGQGAHLIHTLWQNRGLQYYSFQNERFYVDAGGKLESITVNIGSKITRSVIDLKLIGSEANGDLLGINFGTKDQVFDSHTLQDHIVPNAKSNLLYKSVLDEQSISSYSGLIRVAKEAQQTDAYQSNRNLMLSDDATANSLPALEIEADDVRCTHGATVSQIDQDQLFYLMSRGIPQPEAERVVVLGFFDEVLHHLLDVNLRSRLRLWIERKLEGDLGRSETD